VSPGPAHRAKVVAAAGGVATFLVALVGFARQGPPPATTPSVSPTVPADPFPSGRFGRFSARPGGQFGNLQPHTTTRGS